MSSKENSQVDFVALTEISGDNVSQEQVDRIARRYYWAANYCNGKEVLEAACGTGQGLGFLAIHAKTLVAGDYSRNILNIAEKHYKDRFKLQQFDAQKMPFDDNSYDVIILFEALYYLPDYSKFFNECRRILRRGGCLLISTANKDLFDFTPSPHSFHYLGVKELTEDLRSIGFSVDFFGDTPVNEVSIKQKIFRPIKMVASQLGLIPKSMNAKKLFKKLIFGKLVVMPPEIDGATSEYKNPIRISDSVADKNHKVIFCAAHKL